MRRLKGKEVGYDGLKTTMICTIMIAKELSILLLL